MIKNINEEIQKEKELIENDVLSKNNLTKKELNMPFFEDFGLYMGEKINIKSKKQYIPENILKEPIKSYLKKEEIKKIEEINKDIYLKLINKEKIKTGGFNNISKESKEKLKYILNDLLFFMLFFNKKENKLILKKINEGHFGNPPSYIYINEKSNISITSINVLNFFDYIKIN